MNVFEWFREVCNRGSRRLAGRRLAVPVGVPVRFEPERQSDHIGFRVVAARH